MGKIPSDNRPNFFPGKTNTDSINTKSANNVNLIPRNNLEKQNEIKAKTENDAKVDISNTIKDFSRIKRAADTAPDIDNSKKIANLKEQIDSGNYQIDYDAIAERMLLNEF